MGTRKDDALAREQTAEIAPLATKLAQSMEGLVEFYQESYKLSRKKAEKKAQAGLRERQRLMRRSPEQVSWMCLSQVADQDAEAGIELWREIREYARDEIESGHRAAGVISRGFDFGPLDRARFLEARTALREEWNPLPGSESMLIDMLAQIQTVWESWLSRHMFQLTFESATREVERLALKERGGWLPERTSEAESMDMSAAMVDRFNKLFIRTLRALRDLKRMAPQVVVQNAGQVNVGSQQVNMNQSD